MGLANRVVASGTSRAAAEHLAREIASFPQLCMRADRASAMHQFDHELPEAILREFEGGLAALKNEGVAGAARFAGGAGRHGDFGR
jgi:enoyl-CoA hydratase